MPSGSRKDDYSAEQYEKQLGHSRAWKDSNRERVRAYNREYKRRKRIASSDGQSDLLSPRRSAG